ncbi:protein-disulfide reductase DsbD [Erythrobacter sp. THAF29]|uniref:protein-disulfide reductase DsbD family protein n=1 Tax=Erythrobacter sp. THAF29 TaxID=2587851 RepID=UPI001267BD3D|nr:thioredoxin family protein [Erythrobacter sp. THAF29]QFT78455.1 Thiol:disulfide interchange protein DsbD precursor [Erythrobacter sp. THAF29]
MFPSPMRHFAAWLVALLAMCALALPASAQEIRTEARYGDENISVELLADGMPVAGEEWMLALAFTPRSDEWHGYWKNPGDAGQGMQLQLALPEGWELGEALYPVPETLVQEVGDERLMNHIYKGRFTVLVPVRVPEDAVIEGIPELTGFVEYLACTDTVCVPQDAVLRAGVGGDFARWRAEVAPLLDAKGTFEITGRKLRIAIPLPGSVGLSGPRAFIANERLVEYAATQTFRREGDLLIAEIPLDEFGTGEADEVSGILAFGDGSGVRFEAAPGDVTTGGKLIAGPVGMQTPPLWTLILGALAGGLLLNIMPCVFPILSLKALSLARAGESEAQARSEGLAYSAGVVLACVGLGAVMLALRAAGEQVGWAFQLQEPGVVVLLLVLATVITVNFAGLFELPGLSITQSGKPGGAFATGLLAAFVATPCTGPFMAAALGAALLLPAPMALLLFAMLGLGLALPFLLIGFVPALRSMLPKPGPWMERFRRIMAIPMGLTVLALVWLTVQLGGRGFALFAIVMLFGIVLALGVVGRLQKAGKMAWPAFGLVAAPFLIFGAFALPSSYEAQASQKTESIHQPVAFNREALAEARASGQPVFLWFTADWCVTCKVNEGLAIERETVRDAFEKSGVVAMVGDWTVRDEEITSFLTEQGAAGVPLYLWYEPGASEPEQLPQVLTTDMLIDRASKERR